MAASISSNSDVTRRPGQALDADAGPTPVQEEATTASSLGEGHDVFKQQVGFNLEFRSLRSGPNVTITSDGEHIDIAATGGGGTSDVQDFTDLEDVPASYSGQGEKFVAVKADETGLEFVEAPSGGGGGEANTASNLGTGAGVFAQKSGVDLQFKSILPGTGVTVSYNDTSVIISAVSEGSIEESTLAGLPDPASVPDLTMYLIVDEGVPDGTLAISRNDVWEYSIKLDILVE